MYWNGQPSGQAIKKHDHIRACCQIFSEFQDKEKLLKSSKDEKKKMEKTEDRKQCSNAFGILKKMKLLTKPNYKSTSLVAQTVNRLPKMRETRVQSLGREDLLEKEMATHSSILAWKIPWMEEPGRLQSMGLQRVRHHWASSVFTAINQVWGHNVFLNVQVLKKKWNLSHIVKSYRLLWAFSSQKTTRR